MEAYNKNKGNNNENSSGGTYMLKSYEVCNFKSFKFLRVASTPIFSGKI